MFTCAFFREIRGALRLPAELEAALTRQPFDAVRVGARWLK